MMTFIEIKGLGWVVLGMAALAACGAERGGAGGGQGSAGEGASAASGGVGGRGAAEAGSASQADAGAPPAEGGSTSRGGEHEAGGSAGGDAASAGNGNAVSVGGARAEAGANGQGGAGGDATTHGGAGGAGGAGAAESAHAGAAGTEAAGGEAQGGTGGDVPPIEREQAGGAPRAIATDASYVYVGVGPRVVIHRVVRGSPLPVGLPFIGETAAFGGNVAAVVVDGARLFVAEHGASGGAVHVLDLAEPARPVLEHSIVLAEGGSRPSALAVDGDTLYAADEEHGIFEIDLAATSGPLVIDSVMLNLRPNQLWLEGSRLYFAGSGATSLSFGTVDRDGLTLLAASSELWLARPHAGFVAPNLLVSHGTFGTTIARVSDSEAPRTLRSLPSLAGSGIVVPGPSLAWVTASDGIHTLDLSDLEDLAHGNAFPLPSAPVVAGAHDDWLLATLAADGETTLWEADDPLAPRAFARAGTALPCTDCRAFGLHDGSPVVPRADATRLWLAELELGGLRPVQAAAANATAAVVQDVAVEGDLIAIADFRFGLRLFELGDFPRALGSFSRPRAWVVALSENRAFLGGSGLTVVDLADPEAPRLQTTLSDAMLVRDLAAESGLLFVADDTSGQGALRILDTSSPTFDEVGSYAGCDRPNSVAVESGLAVLGCGDRFEVVDVSAPEQPVYYATWAASSPSLRAVLRDGLAYLADAEGIRVVDVASGRELAAVAVKGVVHLEVPHPGRIVASLGAGGIRQWQL